MDTSARALTAREWEILLDIAEADARPIHADNDEVDRLVSMGLAVEGSGGTLKLSWLGREFAELRASGLLDLGTSIRRSAA